ncbi:hypothetical protein F5876DRAFT_82487 [Lentinula aff. lateritia]|uniref:Uncharacterized protein n=1 Tax=Lentinula aff. lateritia TaxID=2804960 RepID=A0ACC1TJI5_9AGAR|nr:hypothetical protein F5876DRAFT_82487 [Lentinula aff. lateritia]
MLWQGHIETQVAKRCHSPSSNGSATGSDHDVATIRAIARRKKKARLAKKPDATFHASEASMSSMASSSRIDSMNTNCQSASDTLVTGGTTSLLSGLIGNEVVPAEWLASAANTGLEPAQIEMGELTQTLSSSSRPQRNRRLPARYQDVLPEGTAAIINTEPQIEEQVPLRRRVILRVQEHLKTKLNSFGLWREYPHKPLHDPDGEVSIEDMSNLPSQPDCDEEGGASDNSDSDTPLNPTQTLLTGWQNNVAELKGYTAQTANAKITKADEDCNHNKLKDSFLRTSVDIEVPSGDKNIPSKKFSIPGLLYRKPLSVIHAAFTSHLANQFHYTPFRLFQTSKTSESSDDEDIQHVHTDVYNSNAFIQEHYRVLQAPTNDPNCKCEKVIAALMCWSDAMQLANFGTAKLWPIYMLFGNLSKYIRASPNSGAVNHLAYIPVIPDSIKHVILMFHTKWRTQSKDIITHCNRELYHAIWRYLLDDEFIHAYRYGIVIKCFDGVECHIYPRFFTYSADYPEKFRQIPTFGFDTIRLFANNASDMKRLAARDFEDLIQCAIPVFEGLLEEADNRVLMKLLYRTAEWHALAKLRLHTDHTLDYMETRTQDWGKLMREFRDLSEKFDTQETDREATARYKRSVEKAKKSPGTHISASSTTTGTHRKKGLNLFTYKWHAMMDYVWFIQWFGPSDIYSTQLGELAHRVVKKLYGIGNKKHDPRQIGRRLRRVEWAKRAFDRRGIHTKRRRQQAVASKDDSITTHYHIGKSNKKRLDLKTYTHSGDPAAKGFWTKLQDHILGRLMQHEFNGDTHETFTDDDRKHIRIKDRKLVELQTLRVNYTTYDIRRDQDTINPRNHADVMMLSPEDEPGAHPYWYARVLRIFRVQVISSHPLASTVLSGPQEMEILWVRWLGVEPGYHSGFQCGRLPKVGFVDEADLFAFGFLAPAHIIRGCHLMPSFSDGRTAGLLQTSEPTAARKTDEIDDWQFFYVGIFVDRDMFMRYFPGGGRTNHETTMPPSQAQAEQPFAIDSDESVDGESSHDSDESFNSDPEGDDDLNETDLDDWQWDDGYGSA